MKQRCELSYLGTQDKPPQLDNSNILKIHHTSKHTFSRQNKWQRHDQLMLLFPIQKFWDLFFLKSHLQGARNFIGEGIVLKRIFKMIISNCKSVPIQPRRNLMHERNWRKHLRISWHWCCWRDFTSKRHLIPCQKERISIEEK